MIVFSLLLLGFFPQQPAAQDVPAAELPRKEAALDRFLAAFQDPVRIQVGPVKVPPPPVAPATKTKNATVQATKKAVVNRNRASKVMTLEVRAVEAPAAGDEEGRGRAAPFMGAINIQDYALASENFDRWIFDDTRSEAARRSHLEVLLGDKISAMQKDRALPPDEVQKLRIAGNGDINRYFVRVTLARKEFESTRQDFSEGQATLVRIGSLSEEYASGPFGGGSLFEKTLRKIQPETSAARKE